MSKKTTRACRKQKPMVRICGVEWRNRKNGAWPHKCGLRPGHSGRHICKTLVGCPEVECNSSHANVEVSGGRSTSAGLTGSAIQSKGETPC